MKYKKSIALVFVASLPAALLWSRIRAPEAPASPESPPREAARERLDTSGGPLDGRLGALEAQMRLLTRSQQSAPTLESDEAPLRASPQSLEAAREPISPEVAIANRLEQFSRVMEQQGADPAGGELVRKEVTAQLASLGLERVSLGGVACYQTLCRLDLGFSDVARRDDDLGQALDNLHADFYAYVSDSKANTAEVYLARPGQSLFASMSQDEL